jgi:hypothetical protein
MQVSAKLKSIREGKHVEGNEAGWWERSYQRRKGGADSAEEEGSE